MSPICVFAGVHTNGRLSSCTQRSWQHGRLSREDLASSSMYLTFENSGRGRVGVGVAAVELAGWSQNYSSFMFFFSFLRDLRLPSRVEIFPLRTAISTFAHQAYLHIFSIPYIIPPSNLLLIVAPLPCRRYCKKLVLMHNTHTKGFLVRV